MVKLVYLVIWLLWAFARTCGGKRSMANTAQRHLESQLDGAVDTEQLLEIQFNANYQPPPRNRREIEAAKLFEGIGDEAELVDEDALDLIDVQFE